MRESNLHIAHLRFEILWFQIEEFAFLWVYDSELRYDTSLEALPFWLYTGLDIHRRPFTRSVNAVCMCSAPRDASSPNAHWGFAFLEVSGASCGKEGKAMDFALRRSFPLRRVPLH